MLNIGAKPKVAAAHAQGLDRDAGGVAPALGPVDEWPYDDDPPDPL